MSITAIEMLTDSYRAANIVDMNNTPGPEQGVTGLRILNQMMGQWDRNGIRLGWTVVAAQDDVLPIDFQDERAVKYNLAVELAGENGVDVVEFVATVARETYAALSKAHMLAVESSLELLPSPDAAGDGRGSIESGGL